MSTTFPTSLQDLDATRGTTGQALSNPNHITHHTNEDDTIEALQTKVGIDSSADTTSLDYKLKSTSSSDPGHKHTTSSLSDFNVSAPSSGQSLVYISGKWTNSGGFKFGGTGADGALSITSGTTTIDCASALVVVKNYTSISITGSGALAFSNPHANGTVVILKSQGGVTITSNAARAIDVRNLGAAAGNGGASILIKANHGTNGSTSAAGVGGVAPFASPIISSVLTKALLLGVGAGGGSGASFSASTHGGSGGGGASITTTGSDGSWVNTANASGSDSGGGAGGKGGGAIYIECSGAFSCSGTLSAAGTNGTAVTAGTGNGGSGAGGGGGGGAIVILYNVLTSNTGTYTVTKGSGGTNATAVGAAGGDGGDGFSLVTLNTEFA